MADVAIIVGGAESVWSEVTQAEELCRLMGKTWQYFVCNDMIIEFEKPAVLVTLHPRKLFVEWLPRRPFPKNFTEVWCHIDHPGVTHKTTEWGGSVGLFACKVAIHKGHSHVLGCGVPMDTSKHARRQQPWVQAKVFQDYWKKQLPHLKPRVRTFSGWTAELLGKPSTEFLSGR